MIDTLTWLMQTSGSDSGGFFATHPGTEDRIDALQEGERPLRAAMEPAKTPDAEGSALEMIAACFRHQHPGSIRPDRPWRARSCRSRSATGGTTHAAIVSRPMMREEAMGHPEAHELSDSCRPAPPTPIVSEAGWLVARDRRRRALRVRVDQARALDSRAGEGAARAAAGCAGAQPLRTRPSLAAATRRRRPSSRRPWRGARRPRPPWSSRS